MQRIKSSAPRREFSSYFQPLTIHMKLDFPSTILDNLVFSQNMLNTQYFFEIKKLWNNYLTTAEKNIVNTIIFKRRIR